MDPLPTGDLGARRRSPLSRGCMGCAMGCAAFMFLAFVVIIGMFYYLTGSGPLNPAQSMIGPDDATFAIVHVDDEDPGIRDLAAVALRQAYRYAPGLTAQQKLELEQSDEQRLSQQVPPMELAFVVHEDAVHHNYDITSCISVGRWKGMLQSIYQILTEGGPSREKTYRGHAIRPCVASRRGGYAYLAETPVDNGIPGPLAENNLILSPTEEGIKHRADRLLLKSGAFGGTGPVKAMYDRLDPRLAILGVVTNDGPLLQTILTGYFQGNQGVLDVTPEEAATLVSAVQRIGFGADVLSADQVTLTLVADCQDETAAVAVAAIFRGLAPRMGGRVKDVTVKQQQATVTAVFHLQQFSRAVDAFFKTQSGGVDQGSGVRDRDKGS